MSWLKQNWLGRLIGLVLAVAVACSIVFIVVRNRKDERVTIEQKQRCQSLQTELEKRIDDTYSGPLYKENSFDEIFYSPIRDSCLYVYRVWDQERTGRPTLYIVDALTNEQLESMWTPDDIKLVSAVLDEFDRIVSLYKDPATKEEDLPSVRLP